MFENYRSTKEDLEAVAEGIAYVWKPELGFIFQNKSLIKEVSIATYDSKSIYIWTTKTLDSEELPHKILEYKAYKIPHTTPPDDEFYSGWRCVLRPPLKKQVPRDIYVNAISGGPLTAFIQAHQKAKREGTRPRDPYYTKESYLATIIHEFGHMYYNLQRNFYFDDKRQTLKYLSTALEFYRNTRGDKTDVSNLTITFPSTQLLSEVFSFCTDYTATSIFWPNHKKDIDNENIERLVNCLEEEKLKDLANEDSVLTNQHVAASVIGKIILKKYPDTWPQIILEREQEL